MPLLTVKIDFGVGAYGYIFTCGFIDMIKARMLGYVVVIAAVLNVYALRRQLLNPPTTLYH